MEGGDSSKTQNPNWEVELSKYENVIVSGTKSMKIKAMLMLANYSKQAPQHVLSTTIPFLIQILDHGNNTENDSPSSLLQEAAAYCLKCFACRGDGSMAVEMGRLGVTHSLMRLLPRAEGKMLKVLIKCLLVVVSFCNTSRTVVAANGGLEMVIGLLNTCSSDVRLYLLEIFSALSLEILSALALRREVRKELVRLGGLRFIVEAAGVGSMISRERACQSIGLIGITRRARHTLVELGVIPVLVELFRVGDDGLKLVAGNTLGVMSNRSDYIRSVGEAGAIPLYAELLQGRNASGKEIAEDVFCILGAVEANAVEIVGHLVRILREGDDAAKAAAANVIWDLSGYKHAISMILDSGAIAILVELLGHGSEEVKLNVSGAFALLSYVEAGRTALADAGAIPVLIDLLLNETEELRDYVVEALSNFHDDTLYHDRVSDVVNVPSFRNLQNRLISVRVSNSNGHMTTPIRRMSVDQLIRNPDHV